MSAASLIRLIGASAATVTALAASAPTQAATLLAAGDIADCASSGDEATAGVLDGQPGTIATLGDNAYENGTAEEFANCYGPSWGRHKARTRPSVGNHEYHTPGAAGYFGYFGAAAGDPRNGYYSYDLGAWHVVALNSNCAAVGGCHAGSPQETWLRADLAASEASCTVAYWHHPRFSSGPHGSSTMTEALWQALYDAGADVVLSGHDHLYERFALMSPSGRRARRTGIRQFTVGTGGRSLYPGGSRIRGSQKVIDDRFGVLRLVLHPRSYSWRFVAVGGQVLDRGRRACHR